MDKDSALAPLEKLSVLVIDDDSDDIYITSEYLKAISHFEINVDSESNYKKAEEAINRDAHDIYFIDYLLGPTTGIELIQNSVARGNKKPFILLTGKGYHTIDAQAAKSGAYDYLIKGEINSEQLERSIRYSLERYKSYMLLLKSEIRYREIFAKSKDIIFLADANARIFDFNDVMPDILGYSREELILKPVTDPYILSDLYEKVIAPLKTQNEIKDIEVSLQAKDGEQKYFIASAVKLKDKEDNIIYQGLLHDYTLRKNLQKENILNEKVGAISRLVRSLAHEIRNPLTNINLAMDQIHPGLTEEDKVFSEIVMRNSQRINNIITELTNLSRSENFNPQLHDIREVLDKTLDKANDRFELNGIKLVRNYVAEPLLVSVDIEKIQIAFLNIIINAIEATVKSVGEVEIQINRIKDTVVVKISDNGSGIKPEVIPSLFEPYFTNKKNGMGLGLATTHNIIKLHKGNIEVQSEPGKGAEFIIKLPYSLTPAMSNRLH